MYVKNLKLNNYRNYKLFDTDFGKGFNVIYGENGQGKTNIIEAIFICSTGKSHRTAHDIELINTEADSFCIDLLFENAVNEKNIKFRYNNKKQKSIAINDINIKKIGELIGKFNTVLFSPEDILIVKQGPALRRRFIDIALSQIKPSYFYNLQQYNKALNQRNSLLRQIKKNRMYLETLDIWDQTLASFGNEIIKDRKSYIAELGIFVENNHYYISGEKEKLQIKYVQSVGDEDLLIKIKQSINSDIERESTGYGPHKDDLMYLLNGENLKVYGSQGQQRTAVLSSKLAELEIMETYTNEKPVLLLDDVLSELDENRQKYLFNRINEIQTFITCTEKSIVKNRVNFDVDYFNIHSGGFKIE